MNKFKMLINGQLVDGDSSVDVINPATEETVAPCPVASEAQLDEAVAGANEAFKTWQFVPAKKRQEMLQTLSKALQDNSDELANLITLEQGKPLSASKDEVMFSGLFCDNLNYLDDAVEVLIDDDNQCVEIHRRPLGVVAGICPWNFPLLIAIYKIAPALATGNTVIIKPAPTTPLTALKLAEIAKDIFPAGVLNIITDNNNLGPAITSHEGIHKVSFTGSTPTGKRIMESAAGTLKRLTLELGGNDAAVVLDDADPEKISEAIFGASFMNSGQVCICLKRLYVHESVYEPVCAAIAELAKNSTVGNGLNAESDFGPVQNKMQYDKVCAYVQDAKENGRIIAGGDIPSGKGYFVPLTVVRDITDGTKVVDEEPFGPVLPIIKFSSVDDVVARVNNSDYGLGASVWSSDVERAKKLAARIESGTVWINQHTAFGPHIPFPPAKQSGIGVEWGKEGMLEFTAMKVVNINKV